jgi:hypothetical protein
MFFEMDKSSKTRKVRGAQFEAQWIQLHYQSARCVELLLFLHGPSDRSKKFNMKAGKKIPLMDKDEGEEVV